jgi:hypothetical protein
MNTPHQDGLPALPDCLLGVGSIDKADARQLLRDYALLALRSAAPSALPASPERKPLDLFDLAVSELLPRVTHVQYDSHEICKHFANELRTRIAATQEPRT